MFSPETFKSKDLTNKWGEKDLSRDVPSLAYDKVEMDYYSFYLAKQRLQIKVKRNLTSTDISKTILY